MRPILKFFRLNFVEIETKTFLYQICSRPNPILCLIQFVFETESKTLYTNFFKTESESKKMKNYETENFLKWNDTHCTILTDMKILLEICEAEFCVLAETKFAQKILRLLPIAQNWSRMVWKNILFPGKDGLITD